MGVGLMYIGVWLEWDKDVQYCDSWLKLLRVG